MKRVYASNASKRHYWFCHIDEDRRSCFSIPNGLERFIRRYGSNWHGEDNNYRITREGKNESTK